MEPLNPTLYGLLQRHFGDVMRIVNPGMEMQWELVHSADDDPGGNPRPKRHIIVPGEEYYLPCPVCNDHKPRLYINHRWGVWDEETRSRNLFLVHCFNEECFQEYARQEWLYHKVYGPRRIRPKDLLQGVQPSQARLFPAKAPGKLIRMDELARRDAEHKAVRYLEERGFDPADLGRRWGVAYCYASALRLADDRILIPISERGSVYGWQARYIGDTYEGKPLKEMNIPKYYTMPGMPRTLLGYNMDRAVRYQTMVLVEGPMDAWSVGPQAFAVLGKTLSHTLLLKLRYWIHLYWGPRTTIFVMLDPDQDREAKRRHQPHHIVSALERLKAVLGPEFNERIIPVYLPSGTDPGALETGYLHERMLWEAKRDGVEAHFGPEWCKPALPPEALEYSEEKLSKEKCEIESRKWVFA